jgi:hypothetical protein
MYYAPNKSQERMLTWLLILRVVSLHKSHSAALLAAVAHNLKEQEKTLC